MFHWYQQKFIFGYNSFQNVENFDIWLNHIQGVSGAISKTANLTHDASVEDVEALYMDAWKLGVKALAVYRDNCKVAQPLAVEVPESNSSIVSAAESVISSVESPQRERLPRSRSSNIANRGVWQ